MRLPHSRCHARRGFTLVELMVACALVVLILTILAVAFGAATASLRQLKATGDMAERLRVASVKLRADLNARHFGDVDSPDYQRVSDLRYDRLAPGGMQATPPRGGYFRIEQGSGSTFEGADTEGVMSTRATTHALEFTAYRRGSSADDLYVVDVPGWGAGAGESDVPLAAGQYAFHWARVRWQLGNPITGPDGVQTWTLYRDVRVLHPQEGFGVPGGAAALEVVSVPTLPTPGVNADSVDYIGNPNTRQNSPMAPYPNTSGRYGDDIVLTNVTSFEVKAAWDGPAAGNPRVPRATLPATAVGAAINDGFAGATLTNSEYPFDDLPAVTENTGLTGQRVFDTWSSALNGWNTPAGANSLPLRIRVTAVQIKIRVHDPKTGQSRQVSFIVDL
jgi:prepilin-type N-terminal cleavage/methylation domain-containing protein